MVNTHTDQYNTDDYSVNNILNFLEMVGAHRIIGPLTAKSRKSSVSSVLVNGDVLNDTEYADARELNVGELIKRIREHYGEQYSPASLETHCSHVRCGINDFIEYNNDPTKYPPGSYTPRHRQIKINRGGSAPRRPLAPPSTNQADINQARADSATFDLQVPIRKGEHTVIISNIPKDIQDIDIKRISAVILAYSNE